MTRRFALPVLLIVAGAALFAQAPSAPPAKPAAQAADPAAAIIAAHKKADDEYLKATMSPFTAVAVRYVDPRRTARLGVGPAGAAFDPDASATVAADFTLDGGAFWVAPVAGAKPPVLLKKAPGGNVEPGPGTPVTAKTKLGDKDIVGLGRFLAEALAQPGSGNVRVFDPDADAKKHFTGLKWYPPYLAMRVEAEFVANPAPPKVIVATSRGLQKEYYRAGTLAFTLDGQPQRLTVLSLTPTPEPGSELFVAFRDKTTGTETYEVGRYLFPKAAAAGAPQPLDFNQATNPLCNYSPHYNCPIPPKENVLTVPVRAGEKTYHVKH